MINGFPDILALFGALKVATRLREAEGKITNDYYFIGNFTSVGLAIAIAAPYESGVARDLLAGIFQCLAGSTASPPPAK